MSEHTWTTLVRPEAAAQRLGVSPSTLAKWRMTGDGPPFRKLSARCVRYALDDLEAYMRAKSQQTTADRAA